MVNNNNNNNNNNIFFFSGLLLLLGYPCLGALLALYYYVHVHALIFTLYILGVSQINLI